MRKKTNRLTEIVLTIFAYFVIPSWLFVVHAADTKELDVDGINLQEIRIPLFLSFNLDFTKSATVFSWISFAGILATIALVIFWIYLILRAAIKAMQSRGETEGLEDVSKRFKSIFVGMFITFLFPVVLSVIGVLIGIGTIFSWPKMFSQCLGPGEGTYEYYFQAYLDNATEVKDAAEYADAQCT